MRRKRIAHRYARRIRDLWKRRCVSCRRKVCEAADAAEAAAGNVGVDWPW